MKTYHRCWSEISLPAIQHNIEEVRKRLPEGVLLLAVVKANAYGHGAIAVARALEDRVDYLAVAALEEAVELREAGIRLPILILGYTSPSQYELLLRMEITPTIYDIANARHLSETAVSMGKTARLHIALDTGMTRIGFQINEEEADRIAEITRLPGLDAEGIFSHFSCADMGSQDFTAKQLAQFEQMLAMLRDRGVSFRLRHIRNSAGIMELEGDFYDMVRSGIVTYGLYPSEEVHKERLDLQPAMAWKAHVIHVKEVGPGRAVSYGATYVTEGPSTRIATISVGYADGYPRALSNRGRVLIRGKYAPILGRICMDQIMVDVSEIPEAAVEDEVTLIGRDGENVITMEEVADPAGRFNYEMACTVCSRVERIFSE